MQRLYFSHLHKACYQRVRNGTCPLCGGMITGKESYEVTASSPSSGGYEGGSSLSGTGSYDRVSISTPDDDHPPPSALDASSLFSDMSISFSYETSQSIADMSISAGTGPQSFSDMSTSPPMVFDMDIYTDFSDMSISDAPSP